MFNLDGIEGEKVILKGAILNTRDLLTMLDEVKEEYKDLLKQVYLMGISFGREVGKLSLYFLDVVNLLFYTSYSNKDLIEGVTSFNSSIDCLIPKAEGEDKEALLGIKTESEKFLTTLTGNNFDNYLLSFMTAGTSVGGLDEALEILKSRYIESINNNYINGLVGDINSDFKGGLEKHKKILEALLEGC